MFEMIVVYTVGTLLGIWFGYKSGVVMGSQVMLDGLVKTGFVLYSEDEKGEITLLRPTLKNLQEKQELK